MRQENREAADEQPQKAEHIDPVRDADDSGMPRHAHGIRDPPPQLRELRGPCRSHAAMLSRKCAKSFGSPRSKLPLIANGEIRATVSGDRYSEREFNPLSPRGRPSHPGLAARTSSGTRARA